MSALKPLFSDIASAIREKDGTGDPIPAERFPERIRAIPAGGGTGPLDPEKVYKETRPADWLPMPEPQDNELYLLFHIPDGASALLAFTATSTGQYTVSLGTVEEGAFVEQSSTALDSGGKYEAELFGDDYGSLTADGFKQVMVKVSAEEILTWKPARHSKRTNDNCWNIVEFKGRLPKATSVKTAETSLFYLPQLRYFSLLGPNEILDGYMMLAGSRSLKAVLALDTSHMTNMGYLFDTCFSLLAIPTLDTSHATSVMGMFRQCESLRAIQDLDLSKATTAVAMFSFCRSLAAAPTLKNTGNVTNMSMMFSGCDSLTSVPEMDVSSVTDMSKMFNLCKALPAAPALNAEKVTNMESMFEGCTALTQVRALNTVSATNMKYMFRSCDSVNDIPALNTLHVSNMQDMFNGCKALIRLKLHPDATAGWTGSNFTLEQSALGHKALVDLIQSLPTLTAKRQLTLKGNPGVSELTVEEKAVATRKNWVLVV